MIKMKIKEVIELTAKNPREFEIYLGDFLDNFYITNNKEKKGLVLEEPDNFKNVSRQTCAFIASAVEKLCNDYEITPPDWVFKDKYFLKEPMFSLNAQGDLRIILLVESPNEFLVRNIFVPENCLQRV
jgi:hypothetical protein